jgi:hypothetical protein
MEVEMIDLARLMLCSQTSFIEKRISDKKYAKVFKDTAVCIIQISARIPDWDVENGLNSLTNEIKLLRLNAETDKPGPISSLFNDQYKYKLLAFDMADDIINSLNSRFVHGNSKAFLGLFDIKGEIH